MLTSPEIRQLHVQRSDEVIVAHRPIGVIQHGVRLREGFVKICPENNSEDKKSYGRRTGDTGLPVIAR